MRKLENENLSHDGFVMLKRWMENRNAGKTFADYIHAEGLGKIEGIPVVSLPQIAEMEEVDALIVSPVVNYDVLCALLADRLPGMRTLSLKEAVYEF